MLAYTSKYWKAIIPFAKKGLIKRYGKTYTKELIPKADAKYRELLNRADDIGADNPMASNMYMALIFFALWEESDGKMTTEDLRGILEEIMSMPILKLIYHAMDMNKPSGVKRVSTSLKRSAAWLTEHPQYQDKSWDYHFDETKHEQGFYYHFTQCPIHAFSEREGFMEVLPVMCDNDYRIAALMRATLHRESTLAKGGSVCDYWFVGDKIKNPK